MMTTVQTQNGRVAMVLRCSSELGAEWKKLMLGSEPGLSLIVGIDSPNGDATLWHGCVLCWEERRQRAAWLGLDF